MVGENKKYYKALLKEPYMKSQYSDMVYEMNHTYKLDKDKKVKMYDNGFHYTDNIYLLPLWYTPDTYYIFEVIPSGEIEFDETEHKYCSEELTIIRQLGDDEIENLYKENRNIIIYNPNPNFRKAAVRLGRPDDLEVLIKDGNDIVKKEFIFQSYGIDRYGLYQKYLSILVNDESEYIRAIVASFGLYHHILINDESWFVRNEVAKHTNNHDYLYKLLKDEDPMVRETASKILKLKGMRY